MADLNRDDRTLQERGVENSIEGKADNAKGHVKDAVGGLTGDSSLQAEGKMDQLKGKAKDTLGKVERKLHAPRYTLVDSVRSNTRPSQPSTGTSSAATATVPNAAAGTNVHTLHVARNAHTTPAESAAGAARSTASTPNDTPIERMLCPIASTPREPAPSRTQPGKRSAAAF